MKAEIREVAAGKIVTFKAETAYEAFLLGQLFTGFRRSKSEIQQGNSYEAVSFKLIEIVKLLADYANERA